MHDLIPISNDKPHPEIYDFMKQALPCPGCGASWIKLDAMNEDRNVSRYLITCSQCKYQGPFGKSLADAVKYWNAPLGFFDAIKRKWVR